MTFSLPIVSNFAPKDISHSRGGDLREGGMTSHQHKLLQTWVVLGGNVKSGQTNLQRSTMGRSEGGAGGRTFLDNAH